MKLGHHGVGGAALERSRCELEICVSALRLPAGLELDRGERHGDRGLALDQLVRQAREQGAQRRTAARKHDVEPALTREVGREPPLLRGDRVADGLDGKVVVGVPARRARMQVLSLAPRPRREATAQQLEEQAMAAIPMAPAVQGDHEAVAPIEILEDLTAPVLVEQGVDEFATELVRHRGAHQELAEVVGKCSEHLAGEVVGDRSVVAREVAHDMAGIVGLAERERRQRERTRPAFGARDERLDIGIREHEPLAAEQLPGLVRRESERGGPELGELPCNTQPLQLQRRIPPARHDQAEARRCDLEQLRDPRENALIRELVEVVEHQHAGAFAVESCEHVADRSRAGTRWCRRKRGLAGVAFACGVERGDDRLPEARLGIVLLVERQPGGRGGRRAAFDPRAQERRLSRSRRRREERQPPGRDGRGQALEEARARDGTPPPSMHGPELRFGDARLHCGRAPRGSFRDVRGWGLVFHGHKDVRTRTSRRQ